MQADIIVRRAEWCTQKAAVKMLRRQVFIEEQGVTEYDEWDDLDDTAYHFIARVNDIPAGTARLLPSGKITRMAVLPQYRNLGIGRSLLDAVQLQAKDLNLKTLTADAQVSALEFYRKCGFTIFEGIFDDAGIPHQRIQIDIQPVIHRECEDAVRSHEQYNKSSHAC